MRRFELSDGKSNKFWQAELDDTSLRVEWGRIGTNGQTQVKEFPSSSAAQAELDKLVKEKLKKGYSEVGGHAGNGASASTTPATATPAKSKAAAAPTPATPQASPAPEAPPAKAADVPKKSPTPLRGSIAWTTAALSEVAPIRGSDIVRARTADAKVVYARLAQAMRGASFLLTQGQQRPGANTALMNAARDAFTGDAPPEKLDSAVQAAAYALIGPKLIWNDAGRADDFVQFWFAREGGLFALRTFLRAQAIKSDASESHIALIEGDAVEKQPWWRTQPPPVWRSFRTVSALASDAEHATLLKEVDAARHDASTDLRGALAAAFERPEWCEADLAQIAATNDDAPWLWPLLVSARSIDDAKAIRDRAQGLHAGHYFAMAMGGLRYDMIARYGASAAKMLVDAIGNGTSGKEALHAIAQGVALIVTSDVAELFVPLLAGRELRAVIVPYLQAHPEISIAPLAQAAVAGKGVLADAARAVLKPIVTSSIAEIAAALPALSPAAQQVIAQIQEQTRAREEASLDDVPRVLRPPPLAPKVKAKAPVVIELERLPFAESMAWKPGEEQQRRSANRWAEKPEDDLDDTLTKVLGISASTPPPNERVWHKASSNILARLPKKNLLEVLPKLDLSRFQWSYFDVASALVAYHGIEMIDFALRSAEFNAVMAVDALLRARSARVAPLMADAFGRLKTAKGHAQEWLLGFPEAAAVGLIPLALGKPGKTRESAGNALRFISERGHRAIVESVAKTYGTNAEQAVSAVLDADPLAAMGEKAPKMPSFWNAGAFTRPLLAGGDKSLPLSAVDRLGTMLASPDPDITDVKEACDPESLADFGWDLFQAWLVAGAPSKESWAFLALGHLGDDETARKLTPLVRAWPGEAAHQRAVAGLEVLAQIGTDVALMHLHGIAQKLKFKALQEKARAKIDQIAETRGLTADELADRLVPDLGLDENGSLTLAFGARSFRVVFDEALKPAVLDDAGKRLPDLPKPKQSDDPEQSKEATDVWKALKKDAKTIATGQVLRLEIAMCAQRRWPTDVFRTFLLEHPLLVHVVRRLVWGVYDPNEKLVGSFRVAEDSSFADVSDASFELPADARLGIAHRLDLADAQAPAWGQILADYEVLQPFAQLSRETAAPTAAEKVATKLTRVVDLKVPTGKVLGLDNRGWRRGAPQDGGVVCWYEKPMANGLVASLDLDPGIYTGMISESPEQKLGPVTIGKGSYHWSGDNTTLALGELSPIAFSELLRDLESLRS